VSTDPVVVAGVSDRLHALAVDLWARGEREVARALESDSRLLARPSTTTGCKSCGQPVPDVAVGRPRLHCHACRPPRTKVRTKPPDPMRLITEATASLGDT
jgi:hypothetical protein